MTPYMVFDTETNGLPNFKLPADDPSQPRIIQIAAALFFHDPENPVDHFCVSIKPDGWQMDDELAAKMGHGLTHERLMAEGLPIAEALDRWEAMHNRAALIVGYNVAFDLKLMRGEFRRLGRPDHYGARPVADIQAACTARCQIPPTDAMKATGRKTFKTAKLGEAVEILLKTEHTNAHDAMADVRATARLFPLVRDDVKIKQHEPAAAPKPAPAVTPASQPAVAPATGEVGDYL